MNVVEGTDQGANFVEHFKIAIKFSDYLVLFVGAVTCAVAQGFFFKNLLRPNLTSPNGCDIMHNIFFYNNYMHNRVMRGFGWGCGLAVGVYINYVNNINDDFATYDDQQIRSIIFKAFIYSTATSLGGAMLADNISSRFSASYTENLTKNWLPRLCYLRRKDNQEGIAILLHDEESAINRHAPGPQ
jgi:hypothetical protein